MNAVSDVATPPVPGEFRASEQIGALIEALAKAMAEFGQITRDRIVTVTPKDGRGSQTFAYATLAEIVEATRPALTKRGLVVIQALAQRGARTMLFTRLAHAPGQWVEGAIAVPQVAHMQQLGSAITYLRRYTYSALLGMAAEDDEDGNAAVGNQATRAQPRKQSAPQPKQLVQSQCPSGNMLVGMRRL